MKLPEFAGINSCLPRDSNMRKSLVFPMVLPLGLMGICWCVVPAFSPAQAEMLQFSTPDGIKSWPKLPDIPDWHQDQESSLRLAANSLFPDGVDPATAAVTIQARGFPRRGNGTIASLSQIIADDRTAAPTGTQVKQLADVADKDGTLFNLYAFAPASGNPGSWKAVAYSEEGDYLLAFTLDARSQAAYEANLPVFTALIQKYARDIPW
jgi:hypothetical protein